MSVKFTHHLQYRIFHPALRIAIAHLTPEFEDTLTLHNFDQFDEDVIERIIQDALWLAGLVFHELEDANAVPAPAWMPAADAIPPWVQPGDKPAQPKKPRKKR